MLPKTVNICGIPHSIKLCEDSFDADTHFGQINYAKAEIKINAGATPELQMQSLFHEMLHGMLVMIGRNDESQDENLVQSLASAMYQSFELKREDNE
jgi:hypothetical protein